MRALTATQLLGAWEQGFSQPPEHRALSLLAIASPDVSLDSLAHLSVGERDAQLLKLREATFGSTLNSQVACPSCRQPLELNFAVSDVAAASSSERAEAFLWQIDEYEIRFRLPTGRDLLTLHAQKDPEPAKKQLLHGCILEARYRGQDMPGAGLPDQVLAGLSERMGELDPQADVQLALTCPYCAHHWLAPLDIASFFWAEIQAWAHRLLREVHALASAYGWDEADILKMSAWRREAYLRLIAQ